MPMEIKSDAFSNGGEIPKKYTCSGGDVSPALSWSGVPPEAKSLALICDDPDAPGGTWVHWVIFDLPPTIKGLREAVAKTEMGPQGSKQGITDFKKTGYGGPCPPPGSFHRYFFKLYALNSMLGLSSSSTKADLMKAMQGRILAHAEIIGRYRR